MFPFTSFIYICKMTWGAVTIIYVTAPHVFSFGVRLTLPLFCLFAPNWIVYFKLLDWRKQPCVVIILDLWFHLTLLLWWCFPLLFDTAPPPKSLLHFLNPLSLNVPASVFAMHGWRLFKITQHMSGQIQSGLCWLVHFSFLSTLSHGLILWDKTVTTIMDSISEESSTILLCSVAFKVCRSHI